MGERKQNLKNAFKLSGCLRVTRPVIIDDVMTTGETCGQFASTLLSAGAECVYVLTIARADDAAKLQYHAAGGGALNV